MNLKIMFFLFFLITFHNVYGEETGNSSGKDDTDTVTVKFPDNLPVSKDQVFVFMYCKKLKLNSENSVQIRLPKSNPFDISVLLPEVKKDSGPCGYLSNTVVLGERDIVVDIESTAISFLMTPFLIHCKGSAGIKIKQLACLHGQKFIKEFSEKIKADPYVACTGNLKNVLNKTYNDAVSAIDSDLKGVMVQALNDEILKVNRMAVPSVVKDGMVKALKNQISSLLN